MKVNTVLPHLLLQKSFCARFLSVLIFQFMSRSNVGHGVKMKTLSKDEITAATLMSHNSKNFTLGTHIYGYTTSEA